MRQLFTTCAQRQQHNLRLYITQQGCQALYALSLKWSQEGKHSCFVIQATEPGIQVPRPMRQVTYPTEMVQEGGDEVLGLAHMNA